MSEVFPVGASITLDEMSDDPYPRYSQLRQQEPLSYMPATGMYVLTRYDDVRSVMDDAANFVVGTQDSLIYDTFGTHMMTVEGALHERFRRAHRPFFQPPAIRQVMESRIAAHADRLIDGFSAEGEVDVRVSFAARLPVITMLELFGLDLADEQHFRRWYDTFESALSNFRRDPAVRAKGHSAVAEFYDYLQNVLEGARDRRISLAESSMLAALLSGTGEQRLTDDEIIRNALIVFFGGISTVEGLILNTLYALSRHPSELRKVYDDPTSIADSVTETIRWESPVQSATRHVAQPISLHDHTLLPGDTVNCMLGAANRDPGVFETPDCFMPGRNNAHRHVGFATGPHHCLGSHLARAEARIGLERLFARLKGFRLDLDRTGKPRGYEFRRPDVATATWR